MGQILDGARIRDEIKAELVPRVEALRAKLGRAPGLSVILAGSNPASQIYVGGKTRAAGDLGIFSETLTPPEKVTTAELLAMVDALNRNPRIDGILVQLPLPEQVDEAAVLMRVSPQKDVDGFHPCNVGMLSTGRPGPRPCTPAGIIQMLKRYSIPIKGKRATVVGRSDIVGKPMAMLLLQENATVTVCHSRTRDLPGVCRTADILIAAIGRAAMITADYIKPGAVVVDVGMNKVESRAEAERIFDLARLVDFERRGQRAGISDVLHQRAIARVFKPLVAHLRERNRHEVHVVAIETLIQRPR